MDSLEQQQLAALQLENVRLQSRIQHLETLSGGRPSPSHNSNGSMQSLQDVSMQTNQEPPRQAAPPPAAAAGMAQPAWPVVSAAAAPAASASVQAPQVLMQQSRQQLLALLQQQLQQAQQLLQQARQQGGSGSREAQMVLLQQLQAMMWPFVQLLPAEVMLMVQAPQQQPALLAAGSDASAAECWQQAQVLQLELELQLRQLELQQQLQTLQQQLQEQLMAVHQAPQQQGQLQQPAMQFGAMQPPAVTQLQPAAFPASAVTGPPPPPQQQQQQAPEDPAAAAAGADVPADLNLPVVPAGGELLLDVDGDEALLRSHTSLPSLSMEEMARINSGDLNAAFAAEMLRHGLPPPPQQQAHESRSTSWL